MATTPQPAGTGDVHGPALAGAFARASSHQPAHSKAARARRHRPTGSDQNSPRFPSRREAYGRFPAVPPPATQWAPAPASCGALPIQGAPMAALCAFQGTTEGYRHGAGEMHTQANTRMALTSSGPVLTTSPSVWPHEQNLSSGKGALLTRHHDHIDHRGWSLTALRAPAVRWRLRSRAAAPSRPGR
jgi:hypothetical protein